jgi:trimeric autotransporter adhesin
MFVNFGSKSSVKTSAAYTVSVVATDPGIFTLGSDGAGDGAILNSQWALVSSGNPAGMSPTSASDTISVFMTGLGAPVAAAQGSSSAAGGWSVACESTDGYLATLAADLGVLPSSIDGAIVQSAVLDPTLNPPCIAKNSPVSATVGGVPAQVLYAGWVPDAVAGLYQVNLTLPSAIGSFTTAAGGSISNITSVVQLPIQITAGSGHSQANVTLWVGPKP